MTFISATTSFTQNTRKHYIIRSEGGYESILKSEGFCENKLPIAEICQLSQNYIHNTLKDSSFDSTDRSVELRNLHKLNITLIEQVKEKHNVSSLLSLLFKISELFYNLFFHGRFCTHLSLLQETKKKISENFTFDIESEDLYLSVFEKEVLEAVFKTDFFDRIEHLLFDSNLKSFIFSLDDHETINDIIIDKRIKPSFKDANFNSEKNLTHALSFKIGYFRKNEDGFLPLEFKVREQPLLIEKDYELFKTCRACYSHDENFFVSGSGLLRFKNKDKVRSVFAQTVPPNDAYATKITSHQIISLVKLICSHAIDISISSGSFSCMFIEMNNKKKLYFNEPSVKAYDEKTLREGAFHEDTKLSLSTNVVDALEALLSKYPKFSKTIISTIRPHKKLHKNLMDRLRERNA